MPQKINSVSELLIAVLPSAINLNDCDDSCGDSINDCPGGCSDNTGCTNNSKGMDSAQCYNWAIDPAALVELQGVLVSALARTEELRIIRSERTNQEKIDELEKRFSAAVAAVRGAKSSR